MSSADMNGLQIYRVSKFKISYRIIYHIMLFCKCNEMHVCLANEHFSARLLLV